MNKPAAICRGVECSRYGQCEHICLLDRSGDVDEAGPEQGGDLKERLLVSSKSVIR
jgi:hypothetical protein